MKSNQRTDWLPNPSAQVTVAAADASSTAAKTYTLHIQLKVRIRTFRLFVVTLVLMGAMGIISRSTGEQLPDDWKVYRNQAWGLEAKHPDNWRESEARDNLQGGVVVGVTFINPQQVSGIRNGQPFVENRPGGRQAVDFFVQKGINPEGLTVSEWAREQADRFKKNRPAIKPTTFAGRSAVESIYPGKATGATFVQLNKTDILSVYLAQDNPDNSRDDIYNRILSSVKLTGDLR
jgi:hypothetical protein